jgi:integrase
MSEAKHVLMGGKLHLYKRENSGFWQCAAFVNGRNHRQSTKEESLAKAKDVAEDFYLELMGKKARGELKKGKTFKHAAEQFLREYEVITEGQRNARYVEGHKARLKNYLLPFFGGKVLSEITPGLLQEYRIHRRQDAMEKKGKAPARNTMHQEIVVLRQVLKTANRHGWLDYLPNLAEPFGKSSKISHRAWFSAEEYKQLYKATRARIKDPKKARYLHNYEQLHDFVLFMANTGLRPDEALRLEYRDVTVQKDEGTGEIILLISVRGKRGTGWTKSTANAVHPFQRLKKRNDPEPKDKVFPSIYPDLFNIILAEEGLKFDREGNRRTAYSLRHTYICLRLMEGADIYQIAKNCRTSVEMIEKYYASHIASSLDAAAINTRRSKKFPSERAKSVTPPTANSVEAPPTPAL